STSAGTRLRIAGGMWGAELINRQSFSQGSLISDGEFLYAAAGGNLDQVEPTTGNIGQTTPYNPPILSRPVVVGNAIWVVSSDSGGNLLATDGGVWGTTGSGMSEWVWFAPGGDLARSFRVSQGAGGGFSSVPVYSGGVVWIGGTHELVCASPATGRALARTSIP